jgi:hypothetical protein
MKVTMSTSTATVMGARPSTSAKPSTTPVPDPQQRPSGPHNALQQSLDRRW